MKIYKRTDRRCIKPIVTRLRLKARIKERVFNSGRIGYDYGVKVQVRVLPGVWVTVWGANYFSLPPTRCFIVWRKLSISEKFSMAMAEYAWTSFATNAKVFECAPQGTRKHPRIHPTQKPIKLYEWIYRMYAKAGDKILDTHLGSGSSRIAAYRMGLDFVGCEIDKEYFDKQEQRFRAECIGETPIPPDAQPTLF